jgi:serine carboxypeptidase-like clade 2
VDALPGFKDDSQLPFDLYAGYVMVNEEAGRALYYTFAESQTNAKEQPLVLWLNGGPGCSSIGGGFLSELGPFYPTPDGKHLVSNPNAWNLDANVLFVESPAFVGFSYSNTSSDIVVGDYRTAYDLVAFMESFLKRFPAYAGRPFWISGESYGGHYVPNLASALLDAQREGALPLRENGEPVLNLRGFLVGNAWTDPEIDNRGTIDYWWAHGLIPDETRDGLIKHCNMSRVGPLYQEQAPAEEALLATDLAAVPQPSPLCQALVNQVPIQMGQINIYDIYADVCLPQAKAAFMRQLAALLEGTPAGAAAAASARAPLAAGRDGSDGASSKYDPCIDNEVTIYLNRRDVQEALNVPLPHRQHPNYDVCNDEMVYNRSDVFTSMLPVYGKLLEAKLEMLVFSGDIDGIVPLIGSRRWIDTLGLKTRVPWRPWYTASGQVGGRVVVYDGLTFSTVRAAGHMVPYTQPERAAHLFRHFIHGKRL